TNATAPRRTQVRRRDPPPPFHARGCAWPSRTPDWIAGQPGPRWLRILKGISLPLGDQAQNFLQVALALQSAALNLVKFSHLFGCRSLIAALFVNFGQAEVHAGVIGIESLSSLKLPLGLLKIALRL